MTRRALARSLAIATVLVVAACGGSSSGGAAKTNAAVAIVPGGPHPYFEPMRQAIVDAKTDFSLTKGTFEVPTDWKQDLQNQLLTSEPHIRRLSIHRSRNSDPVERAMFGST